MNGTQDTSARIPRLTIPEAPDLAEHLNLLADILEDVRAREVVFGDDFKTEADGRQTAVALRDISQSSTEAEIEWHPWKAYPSPYVGTGSAPENQADRWRIACGIIDGNQAPTNRNDEFVLDAEGDNWIWLHLLFAPTLLLTTIELRSGDTLEEGYFSEDGEALVIVPIFHVVKVADAAPGFYSLKVQHAKRDMTSTKVLVAADCAMRRMRPALSPSA